MPINRAFTILSALRVLRVSAKKLHWALLYYCIWLDKKKMSITWR